MDIEQQDDSSNTQNLLDNTNEDDDDIELEQQENSNTNTERRKRCLLLHGELESLLETTAARHR